MGRHACVKVGFLRQLVRASHFDDFHSAALFVLLQAAAVGTMFRAHAKVRCEGGESEGRSLKGTEGRTEVLRLSEAVDVCVTSMLDRKMIQMDGMENEH